VTGVVRKVIWKGGRRGLPAGWDRTLSLCPECLATVPAAMKDGPSGVTMEKTCPEHGMLRTVISSDVETYARLASAPRKVTAPLGSPVERDEGCPGDCGLCAAHDQRTCLAIMEITSRCDLGCPVCLADCGIEGWDLVPRAVESALRGLRETEGTAVSVQLSGGEPTGHPDLVEIVRRAAALGFGKLEIDTNGLALARDRSLADRLREAGLTGVYLQMDGVRPRALEVIRGRDLVEDKLGAIERCRDAGLQVVLSVTVVPGVNDQSLWEMIRFGVGARLTGVNFQPVALSGRFPQELAGGPERFTLGHFLHEVERQSGGTLLARDLMPIPCPDTRCGVMAYALVHGGELVPLSRLVDERQLLEPMADFGDWADVLRRIETATGSCGCEGPCGPPAEGLGALLGQADYFSIGAHAMMDAYSFDYQRARRCCVHELTPDGALIPFCLYNIKYRRKGSQPDKAKTAPNGSHEKESTP
jgi:tetraether lipid synthase